MHSLPKALIVSLGRFARPVLRGACYLALALTAGGVTSLVLNRRPPPVTASIVEYRPALPSIDLVAASKGLTFETQVPLAVGLSAAFTLRGLEESSENFASEFVLHMARPDAGPAVQIGDWQPPQIADARDLSSAQVLLDVRRRADAPSVPALTVQGRMPPRPVLASAGLPTPGRPTSRSAKPENPVLKPFVQIRGWFAQIPNPLPSKDKVVASLSSLGGTLGGLVPKL